MPETGRASGAAEADIRVLVVLVHSGFLRLLDGVVDELLARGARVELVFSDRHKPPFGRPRFEGARPGLTVHAERLPRRSGPWTGFAEGLRRTGDYLRYLGPSYRDAPSLRARSAERLPRPMAWLGRLSTLPRPLLKPLQALCGAAERLVPTAPALDGFLAEVAPDLVLVSPLVDYDSAQIDLIKSARAAGTPCALCAGSWDNLTTKSLMHVRPDRVFVWNEAQGREAVDHHGVAAADIEAVGASAFDKWFGRPPSLGRNEIRARLGLPADRPYLVYACSSVSICDSRAEMDFVERWLRAIRRDHRLAGLGVVIRPHPQSLGHWRRADPARFAGAVVHPREGANPIEAADKAEYFDTLHHCAALVGINTSAMVEAAIIGRPVLTVLEDRFNQRSTLHFHHLLPENGGCLIAARDLPEHVEQLARAVADPGACAARLQGFVDRFIRPRGRDRKAAAVLAEAALELARRPRRPRPAVPAALAPLSRALGRRLAQGSFGAR